MPKMQLGSTQLRILSKVLFRMWLGAIAASVVLASMFFAIPNEVLDHFGTRGLVAYAVPFVEVPS